MSETLCSVGLDVGTTSTQLVVSELTVENRASAFSVPEQVITRRRILHRSPVYFTPLLSGDLVDGEKLRTIVEQEYARAGITRSSVDTGAVIITGETSRKENANTVLQALSDLAGDFVVATAGPDLEAVLAARGAGAVELSLRTQLPVLHLDIGGGTSNLALIRNGEIRRTGCLNIGGRLLKTAENGTISYISPVLQGITSLRVGQAAPSEALEALAGQLTNALAAAAGLVREEALLDAFQTAEAARPWQPPEEPVLLSFSGGVADCILHDHPTGAFGDLGPQLGRAIRKSILCRGDYVVGEDGIRATVLGAGCHSTQLSGSTVYYQNIAFPLKNLPVVHVRHSQEISGALSAMEGPSVLALPVLEKTDYAQVALLAETIACFARPPVLVCLEQDLAKALGQALALRLGPEDPVLCIDRVRLSQGSYLDIGNPLSCALPVVVKTLALAAGAPIHNETIR